MSLRTDLTFDSFSFSVAALSGVGRISKLFQHFTLNMDPNNAQNPIRNANDGPPAGEVDPNIRNLREMHNGRLPAVRVRMPREIPVKYRNGFATAAELERANLPQPRQAAEEEEH
ncbi:uncharacterized protein LOC119661960 [Teleopsis dalmanni]|uniref:uncharacterized protein LOC119661960 n=1 Tax=Teleopsis dalmanni TaxID=139649 RepID=UPI0018CFDB4F|nr:uncharacterized protein LOC119661960 [Teleopsis dalmanni]